MELINARMVWFFSFFMVSSVSAAADLFLVRSPAKEGAYAEMLLPGAPSLLCYSLTFTTTLTTPGSLEAASSKPSRARSNGSTRVIIRLTLSRISG